MPSAIATDHSPVTSSREFPLTGPGEVGGAGPAEAVDAAIGSPAGEFLQQSFVAVLTDARREPSLALTLLQP